MIWLVCIVLAYIVGSVPFGVILSRARGVDIFSAGSGNIGATNVGRVLGKPWGAVCFALDVLKGAVPVALAGLLTGVWGTPVAATGDGDHLSNLHMSLWLAVAAAAVVGHMYSIFLRFKGGKGVATGFGAMVGMWPVLTFPALGALVIWYATVRITRYVSVASVVAAASLPVGYLLSIIPRDAQLHPLAHTIERIAHAWPPLAGTTLIALLVAWKHRGNFARLRKGQEPKVGQTANQQPQS